MAGGPTWYEILGVSSDASAAEIKAAWRDATDKFEPGTGASQFRLFNEAADTLLDPDKRREYDASLGVETAAGPVVLDKPAPVDVEPVETPEPVSEADAEPDPDPEPAPVTKTRRSIPVLDQIAGSTFALALIAALAVIALIAGGFVVKNIQDQRSELDNGAGGTNGGLAAQAVAERGITAALSYDYRHLDADRDKASAYVAPSFRKEFLATYELISQGPNGTPGGAIKLKAVQTAELEHSAVEPNSNSKLAKILVFLNTTTSKAGTTPQVRAWRIVVTMQRSGEKWLISRLDIY